jgi:AcrR family transcriptional regulator
MPPSRRDELIESAMRVFHKNGFHASGLDRVLEESGISRMTLYNHFNSKDELIVAALHRRDEIFRNNMMKFVEARAATPRERILAVFDFHREWYEDKNFSGCMFINAAAEFMDPQSEIRQAAAAHKRAVVSYLRDLCRGCGFVNSDLVAEQLNILLEGATVTAQVVEMADEREADTSNAATLAKRMAEQLLDQSPRS